MRAAPQMAQQLTHGTLRMLTTFSSRCENAHPIERAVRRCLLLVPVSFIAGVAYMAVLRS
jgi:hypothetical protein